MHDRLVTAEVLDMARRDADRIDVGKRSAQPHACRRRTSTRCWSGWARQGRKVVRLKGGDPFIFGRGGEETEALAAAGVAFEVVPGITAALACAAGAASRSPTATQARTLTLATGHTRRPGFRGPGRAAAAPSPSTWACSTLPRLRDGFFAAGLDPATPAALIESGGTSISAPCTARSIGSSPLRRPGRRRGLTLLIGAVIRRAAPTPIRP